MEIRLSPELQDKLRRMASQQGRDQESLVQGAVERLIDYDEWFERQVNLMILPGIEVKHSRRMRLDKRVHPVATSGA